MITHLAIAPVFVSNVDESIKFFRDKLGFAVTADVPFASDFRWVTLRPPKSQTDILLYSPSGAMGNKDELEHRIGSWTGMVFYTDDIWETYKDMLNKGVIFEAEPAGQPWGGMGTWFFDPDKNRYHLAQP